MMNWEILFSNVLGNKPFSILLHSLSKIESPQRTFKRHLRRKPHPNSYLNLFLNRSPIRSLFSRLTLLASPRYSRTVLLVAFEHVGTIGTIGLCAVGGGLGGLGLGVLGRVGSLLVDLGRLCALCKVLVIFVLFVLFMFLLLDRWLFNDWNRSLLILQNSFRNLYSFLIIFLKFMILRTFSFSF